MKTKELENILFGRLNERQIYDRQAILKSAQNFDPKISEDSLSWILSHYITEGKLQKLGRNKYVKGSPNLVRPDFNYPLGDIASTLEKNIKKQYPNIRFTIFETRILNQFLNHLRSDNFIFLNVEKDFETPIFDYIQETTSFNVYLKPTPDVIKLYIKNDAIIVDRLGSEYPRNKILETRCSGEGLMIDLLRNKTIGYLMSQSEIETIIREIETHNFIDYDRMFRYGRRRNAEAMIRGIIKTSE